MPAVTSLGIGFILLTIAVAVILFIIIMLILRAVFRINTIVYFLERINEGIATLNDKLGEKDSSGSHPS